MMQVSCDENIPLRPGSAVEKRRAGRGTPVLRLMLNLRGPKPESSPTVPMVAVWQLSECRSEMRERWREMWSMTVMSRQGVEEEKEREHSVAS